MCKNDKLFKKQFLTKKVLFFKNDLSSLIVYQLNKQKLKKGIAFLLISLLSTLVNAQVRLGKEQSASFTIATGSNQFTTAFSYRYLWNFGKKKQWQMGSGLRFTSAFGNKNYNITAPAKITSGKKGPAVFFAEQLVQNIDSIYILKPQVNAFNISVNFGYKINDKFTVGFDIDAIGFSFGAKKAATYLGNGGAIASTNAKPTTFNLLLVSDNDLGSLNSEFFGQYNINKKWSTKLGFQFLFTEYTTDTKIQTTPSGEKNDRFRYKAPQISIGTTYQF